jgi:hypothetical protein
MAFQAKQRATWAGPIVCGLAAGLFLAFAVSTALRAQPSPGSGSSLFPTVACLGMALLFVGFGAAAAYVCLRPKVITVEADRILVRRGETVTA